MSVALKMNHNYDKTSRAFHRFGITIAKLHINSRNSSGYYSTYDLWNRWLSSL